MKSDRRGVDRFSFRIILVKSIAMILAQPIRHIPMEGKSIHPLRLRLAIPPPIRQSPVLFAATNALYSAYRHPLDKEKHPARSIE